MLICRKEHAVVYINNKVYALGGFNSISKEMLDTCEEYNIE
jgi:hypothetical protein